MGLIGQFDRYQRRHRRLGIPIAVIYKFADDQGFYLAALITYYGFLSVFPLLLIFATVLGFLLPAYPWLQEQLIDSTLSQFPIIGDELTSSAQPLRGSGAGLVTGILVSLYGGLGFAVAIQSALDQVWGVPMNKRPNPLTSRLRSLVLLVLLGIGVLLITGLAALSGVWEQLGSVVQWAAILGSIAGNTALFAVAFRALTVRTVSLRDTLPGAVLAAVAWQGLQAVGALYIAGQLQGSTQVYGLFGIVLGLMGWIFAQAFVLVLAAELNVVLAERLWPRALLTPFIEDVDLTRADRRSYESYATAQRFREAEDIAVDFRSEETEGDGEREDGDEDEPEGADTEDRDVTLRDRPDDDHESGPRHLHGDHREPDQAR